MILQGIFDSAEISNVIRAETIRQLEKRALIHTPTDEELKVYIKLKKYSDYTKASSIDLILTETNISTLVETMNTFMNIFKDAKKLSVYLDWKKDTIISTLKQSEDWEKYYSLSKYIEFDVLNLFVEKYFEHTMVLRQLVTLIVFSQSRNDKQLDDLLRKILTTMKRSTYSDLKQEIEKGNEDISDYFTSLNKGIQLKRLFNFKF
ncbi:hypothetical protein FACS1894181_18600 [Bacteroidia bacterium]|nr:hypothetical protein FACS1894181_18600 [Bacteroidia bacterium]